MPNRSLNVIRCYSRCVVLNVRNGDRDAWNSNSRAHQLILLIRMNYCANTLRCWMPNIENARNGRADMLMYSRIEIRGQRSTSSSCRQKCVNINAFMNLNQLNYRSYSQNYLGFLISHVNVTHWKPSWGGQKLFWSNISLRMSSWNGNSMLGIWALAQSTINLKQMYIFGNVIIEITTWSVNQDPHVIVRTLEIRRIG